MTLSQPHETEGARASTDHAMREPATDRSGAVLVPFPAAGARRNRRIPRAGERRGEILLFLGVRYERLAS